MRNDIPSSIVATGMVCSGMVGGLTISSHQRGRRHCNRRRVVVFRFGWPGGAACCQHDRGKDKQQQSVIEDLAWAEVY